MSDPRLDGDWTVDVNNDAYPSGVRLWMGAYRVENDGGARQELPNLAFDFLDGTTSTRMITLVGAGGYAGSTAVAEVVLEGAVWELHGFILEVTCLRCPEPPRPDGRLVDGVTVGSVSADRRPAAAARRRCDGWRR